MVIAYQCDDAAAELQLGEDWHVYPNDALMLSLKHLCGDAHVVLEYR